MSIVNFPPREPKKDVEKLIWACHCGCISFELCSDGTTECCGCGTVSNGPEDAGWHSKKPRAPNDAPVTERLETVVTRFNSSKTALDRVMGEVNSEDSMFLIVAQRDGALRTWANEEYVTSDAVWWLDDKLATARTLLLPEGAMPRTLDAIRYRITNSEELHCVAVIRQDGEINAWLSANCPVDTPAQRTQLQRDLNVVYEMLVNDPPKETP